MGISNNFDLANNDKATEGLLQAVKKLNNCEDLQNLLEIHDARDELNTLTKLFKKQIAVIDQMILEYLIVDRQNDNEDAHARARTWLVHSKRKVDGYIERVSELLEDCEKSRKTASRPRSTLEGCC